MLKKIKNALTPEDIFYRHNFLGISAGLIAVIQGLAIYNGDTTLVPHFVCILLLVVCLSLGFISLFFSGHGIKIESPLLLFALLSYWFVNVVHVADGIDTGLGLPTLFFSIYISCVPKEQFKVATRLFVWLFFIICLLGIIAYASFVLGLSLPHEIVPYYSTNHNENAFYIDYHFGYILMHGVAEGLRLCGLFNEPGYLGTFAAFVLMINRFKFNFQNIIIFIAAVLSFSMAFFALIIIYWAVRAITEGKKAPIIIAAGYLFLNVLLPQLNTNNPEVEGLIARFSITESGKLEGDDREDDRVDLLQDYRNDTMSLLFGRGHQYQNAVGVTIVSYKRWIVEYGYVGFFFFFGLFLIYGLKLSKNKRGSYYVAPVVYLLLFFINTYQRPYLYDINYVLLLFGGIMLLVEDEEIEKCKRM